MAVTVGLCVIEGVPVADGEGSTGTRSTPRNALEPMPAISVADVPLVGRRYSPPPAVAPVTKYITKTDASICPAMSEQTPAEYGRSGGPVDAAAEEGGGGGQRNHAVQLSRRSPV